jgi:hypothetical protein
MSIKRRQDAIREFIGQAAVIIAVDAVAYIILVHCGINQNTALILTLIFSVLLVEIKPKRRRYIPVRTRRRAIARFELETGQKFNSKKHELDHGVPFSKGGNNTDDNIKVISKQKNRAKGARSEWWDVLGS